jgi:hypothetical protein
MHLLSLGRYEPTPERGRAFGPDRSAERAVADVDVDVDVDHVVHGLVVRDDRHARTVLSGVGPTTLPFRE